MAWIYLVGVVGLSLNITRPLFEASVPYTLLLSLFALALFHEKYTVKFLIVAGIIYLAGLAVEIAGVATGKIFGYYEYGPTLGLKVMATPLMIGVNWLTLVYMIWILLSDFRLPRLAVMVLGPVIMVIYDFLLEPVAIWTDMWNWGGDIPMRNYAAWFVISLVFFILVGIVSPKMKNKIAPALFLIQLAFFVALNLVLKIFY